ncbi:hypothetical protein [Streptomyces cinereoruber]|uniref:hypothetical protein n=1 Tax=Streptomyces cinereoruber TaxID=67260 RepID=UPI00362C230E
MEHGGHEGHGRLVNVVDVEATCWEGEIIEISPWMTNLFAVTSMETIHWTVSGNGWSRTERADTSSRRAEARGIHNSERVTRAEVVTTAEP